VSTIPAGFTTAPASFVTVPGADGMTTSAAPAGGALGGLRALGGAGAATGLGAGLLAGGAGGLGGGANAAEGGLRDAAGNLREPGAKVGAYERENLTGARSAGGLGAPEEMVNERGLMGAPMGGGARRRDDDDERKLPGYLEDPDGVWTVSEDGVPPVLGEDG
jgi:hypothetical protein